MLKIILNRLKPQAEEMTEEYTGFRAGRSTTEQILILESCVQSTGQPELSKELLKSACVRYPVHYNSVFFVETK